LNCVSFVRREAGADKGWAHTAPMV
jgi:hypothetical protein